MAKIHIYVHKTKDSDTIYRAECNGFAKTGTMREIQDWWNLVKKNNYSVLKGKTLKFWKNQSKTKGLVFSGSPDKIMKVE